jgi:hypothetical protein
MSNPEKDKGERNAEDTARARLFGAANEPGENKWQQKQAEDDERRYHWLVSI